MTLSDLGMKREDLSLAAGIMTKNPYWNPQPLVENELLALLEDAFEGNPPGQGLERR
jgi:maleylacetate reductase